MIPLPKLGTAEQDGLSGQEPIHFFAAISIIFYKILQIVVTYVVINPLGGQIHVGCFIWGHYPRAPCSYVLASSTNEEGTGEPTFPETVEDEFRRIYFEAIHLMIHSIDQRFSQPSFKAHEQLELVLLKTLAANDFADELEYLKMHYDGDIDAFILMSQLRLLLVMFKEDIIKLSVLTMFCRK